MPVRASLRSLVLLPRREKSDSIVPSDAPQLITVETQVRKETDTFMLVLPSSMISLNEFFHKCEQTRPFIARCISLSLAHNLIRRVWHCIATLDRLTVNAFKSKATSRRVVDENWI